MANATDVTVSETSFVYSLVYGDKASTAISTLIVALCLSIMCVLKVIKLIAKWRKGKLSTPQLQNALMQSLVDLLTSNSLQGQEAMNAISLNRTQTTYDSPPSGVATQGATNL